MKIYVVIKEADWADDTRDVMAVFVHRTHAIRAYKDIQNISIEEWDVIGAERH